MVINIGALRSGRDAYVKRDRGHRRDGSSRGAIVKVILENAYLDDDQKVRGCDWPRLPGGLRQDVDWFCSSGATHEDSPHAATVSPKVA